MATVIGKQGSFTLKAYQGDAKTLLAFDLTASDAHNLAGFTVQVKPSGVPAYYLYNTLSFQNPNDHAQVASEPSNSSVNAPLHKFNWLHVPGVNHQGTSPVRGKYTYTVSPRYFDSSQKLTLLDSSLSASVSIAVVPFEKDGVELGFARGFVQSQAYVRHFGPKLLLKPAGATLMFDTSKVAGSTKDPTTGKSVKFTFAEEFDWLGFTAREKILGLLNEVAKDKSLHLDVFAYDLNEPDVVKTLCQLAGEGRIRLILDNAALHHNSSGKKPEDQVEKTFRAKKKKGALMVRGKFGRYAHDKVLIVSKGGQPKKVLTGSTNFSTTGMYVNSNHVVIFNDPDVANQYEVVFNKALQLKVSKTFAKDPLATKEFAFSSQQTPQTEISFAPHTSAVATKILGRLTARIGSEGKNKDGSVLFAVMQLDKGTGPVLPALTKLHASQSVFSYGVSDTTKGIQVYRPGTKRGVLVTGKPAKSRLPEPFTQVPALGLGHQIHHKFVVCGFPRPDAVVYCGSSNLALGGETANGDNLIAIHDPDIATAFAIEAIGLVDHFNFLDTQASPKTASKSKQFFLGVTDAWTKPYYDPKDLRMAERELLG
jgi:PLD-like domain